MSGDTSMRKKRETYRKKSENAIYTDIREKLKTAIALEHMGKKSEADDVVNGIKEKISNKSGSSIEVFSRNLESCLRKMEGFVYARYGKKRKMSI